MIVVDKETCIGCGSCSAICGEIFDLKEGKAFVKPGQEESKAPCAKEAQDSCPVNAISGA
jgi:ferredoxin